MRNAYHEGRRRFPRPHRQAHAGPTRFPDSHRPRDRAGDGIQRQARSPICRRPQRPEQDQGPRPRPAISSRASACCATTAARLSRAAGSMRARGRRPATRWRGATTPTPTAIGQGARTGRGPGPRTGAFCTTARRPTRPPASPGSPNASLIAWDGKAVERLRHSRHPPRRQPDGGRRRAALHHERPRAWPGCSRPPAWPKGPLPEHYEPFESPLVNNPMHGRTTRWRAPTRRRASSRATSNRLGVREADFPYVATSYRLTEHFHYWTKNVRTSAIIQPQQFVEIGRGARPGRKGIARRRHGSRCGARSAATSRRWPSSRPSASWGSTGRRAGTVHTVGLPNHWGFIGLAKPGYLVNTLTPFVGDANTQTPEYKSFTVNIEKA